MLAENSDFCARHVTPAAVSHQIRMLEDYLGVQLFHRYNRALELTDAAKDLLFTQGYDPNFGARPLKRAIQKLIQDPLALKILDALK